MFNIFNEKCAKNELKIPIICGIFAFSSYTDFVSFLLKLCTLDIPQHFKDTLEEIKNDKEEVHRFGILQACMLIKQLSSDCSSTGFHIFSLNNINLVKEIALKLDFIK